MNKLGITLVAASLALVGGAAQAAPVWGQLGYNNFSYTNFENLYRTTDSCAANGGCLPTDFVGLDQNNNPITVAGTDPTGYQRVDASQANNVLVGDIFSGIMNVTQITDQTLSPVWSADVIGPTYDQFTGYFAQAVTSITAPASHDPLASPDHLTLGAVTTDPWGIFNAADLGSNTMFKMYVDTGTVFNASGLPSFDIGLATDGTLWGTLGIDGGYSYTHTDESLSAQAGDIATFFAVNLLTKGAGYNAGDLTKVNSTSEDEIGGVSSAFICNAADLADPNILCTNFVGKSNIQINESNTIYGNNAILNSSWIFESHDPVELQRIPEPASLALLGLGLVGLAGLRRRSKA